MHPIVIKIIDEMCPLKSYRRAMDIAHKAYTLDDETFKLFLIIHRVMKAEQLFAYNEEMHARVQDAAMEIVFDMNDAKLGQKILEEGVC